MLLCKHNKISKIAIFDKNKAISFAFLQKVTIFETIDFMILRFLCRKEGFLKSVYFMEMFGKNRLFWNADLKAIEPPPKVAGSQVEA